MSQRRTKVPLHEDVFSSSADCPVKVRRDRRRDPLPSTMVYHSEWELQLILKGEGFYFIAGSRYPFQPNVLFAIPPNQTHYFALTPGCMGEKWKMIFRPSFLRSKDLTRALACLSSQTSLTETEVAAVVLLFHGMKNELDCRETHWKEIVRLKMAELLWLLNRASRRPSPPPVTNRIVQQLVDHIEHHFAQPLRVPELAERFGYSEGHLSHVFKDHTGISVMQYVQQRRIAEARRLLETEPAITVASVGESVGFSHYGIFNRMFKSMVGLTPATYRRNSHLDDRK